MPSKKKITPEEAVADLKSRKHAISKGSASTMIKKFKTQHGKLAKAAKSVEMSTDASITFPAFLSYNKKAVTKLLGKKDCIGLRIYPALNAQNEFTLVLVGIDEKNNDITGSSLAMDEPATATKTVKKSTASMMMAKDAASDDVLDEGQASPPYPPPSGGL